MNLAWKDGVRLLNECHYLYMRVLSEPRDNEVRFLIEEARLMSPAFPTGFEEPDSVEALFLDARPIESDSSSRLFEVTYSDYISYTISNETYGKYPEPPEVFTGKLFREFRWSYLLEMTRRISYASDDHPGPGPLEHHELVCLNHVIDVITTRPPAIRLMDRLDADHAHVH